MQTIAIYTAYASMVLHTASRDHYTGGSEICLFVSNEAPFDKLNPPHKVHYNIALMKPKCLTGILL